MPFLLHNRTMNEEYEFSDLLRTIPFLQSFCYSSRQTHHQTQCGEQTSLMQDLLNSEESQQLEQDPPMREGSEERERRQSSPLVEARGPLDSLEAQHNAFMGGVTEDQIGQVSPLVVVQDSSSSQLQGSITVDQNVLMARVTTAVGTEACVGNEVQRGVVNSEVEWMGILIFRAFVDLLETALEHPEVPQLLSAHHAYVQRTGYLCLSRILEIYLEIGQGSTDKQIQGVAALLLECVLMLEIPVLCEEEAADTEYSGGVGASGAAAKRAGKRARRT